MTTLPQDYQSTLQLPLDHLQLSLRAYNFCIAYGYATIGNVMDGVTSGRLTDVTIGEKTAGEIEVAIERMRNTTREDGTTDWEQIWEAQGIAPHRIALTSMALQRLGADVRALGLGALHLKKACSALEAAGINTLGGLLDAARSGIGKLRNLGKTASTEVVQALKALSKCAMSDGTVDWCQYATVRSFPLIPESESQEITGETLLRLLPRICQTIVAEQFDERAWQIFKRRLLVPEDQQETLDSIGSVYDLTRERIRQIESVCLNAIRKPLFDNDYRGLAFRFRPTMSRIFREAREHYELLGMPAWRESSWVNELATLWQVKAAHVTRFDRLLAELLGYRWLRLEHPSLEPLIIADSTVTKDAGRIVSLVDAIYDALSKHSFGLDAFGMAKVLKSSGSGLRDLDEIPALIALCSSAEIVGADTYRLRFQALKGRPEQVVRVLSEHGKPLHHNDLIREINRRLPAAKRVGSKGTFVGHISRDPRLQPIGRTGRWALAEWGVETRSLVDVIEDVLTTAGEALHQDELITKVLHVRPGAEASIPMLLQFNPDRFRKIAPKIYALASWGDVVTEETWCDKDEVARFVQDFFFVRKVDAVDFKELNDAFAKESGLSSRSARGVLSQHPAVHVERPDHHKRIARFRADWKSVRGVLKERVRPLQSEQLVDRTKALLRDAPTGELPLIEIVRRLEAEMRIQRPNIYAAIDQSDELEKIAVEGSVFKICRLRGRSDAKFPQIQDLRNIQWKQECERAVLKLTLEEVDIGLFLLGRQFDQAMRQMLEVARNSGSLPVLDGHINKLQNRIDWALNQGVFRDKATLNLLRIERNERGHEPPTLDERRAIMKFAPFLAGLYLDYLILIQDRIDGALSGRSHQMPGA
jgi:hypothetical protein